MSWPLPLAPVVSPWFVNTKDREKGVCRADCVEFLGKSGCIIYIVPEPIGPPNIQ